MTRHSAHSLTHHEHDVSHPTAVSADEVLAPPESAHRLLQCLVPIEHSYMSLHHHSTRTRPILRLSAALEVIPLLQELHNLLPLRQGAAVGVGGTRPAVLLVEVPATFLELQAPVDGAVIDQYVAAWLLPVGQVAGEG